MEPEPILPNPNVGAPEVSPSAEVVPVSHEATPASPERSTGAAVPQQPVQQSQVPQQPVTTASSAMDGATQQAASPAIADDVDVIEKEWVDKAKKIVSTTKDDPHEQEKEVSKLQADYLMKRYGKQIKTVE